MNDEFLISQVISYVPDWFVPIFRENERLCLPYVLSMRDVDDIIRTASSDAATFYVQSRDFTPVLKSTESLIDFMNSINDLVFQNSPCEVIVSFNKKDTWIYYDGDQRFCCLIASSHILQEAFRNGRDVMRLYYIDQTDDIGLNDEIKTQLYESVTTDWNDKYAGGRSNQSPRA